MIISAFPGTGKTHFFNEFSKQVPVHDSDSSKFSWLETESGKVRNPDFPNNYIDHIKSIESSGIVLVSSHLEVRNALNFNNMRYYLVFPEIACKEEYLQRYKDRGSPDSFIQLLDKMYETWVDELLSCNTPNCIKVVLGPKQYVTDVFPTIGFDELGIRGDI